MYLYLIVFIVSVQVARSFFERAYNSLLEAISNPFFSTLKSSASFKSQISNCIQSHSVMMTFMSSSEALG